MFTSLPSHVGRSVRLIAAESIAGSHFCEFVRRTALPMEEGLTRLAIALGRTPLLTEKTWPHPVDAHLFATFDTTKEHRIDGLCFFLQYQHQPVARKMADRSISLSSGGSMSGRRSFHFVDDVTT